MDAYARGFFYLLAFAKICNKFKKSVVNKCVVIKKFINLIIKKIKIHPIHKSILLSNYSLLELKT